MTDSDSQVANGVEREDPVAVTFERLEQIGHAAIQSDLDERIPLIRSQDRHHLDHRPSNDRITMLGVREDQSTDLVEATIEEL